MKFIRRHFVLLTAWPFLMSLFSSCSSLSPSEDIVQEIAVSDTPSVISPPSPKPISSHPSETPNQKPQSKPKPQPEAEDEIPPGSPPPYVAPLPLSEVDLYPNVPELIKQTSQFHQFSHEFKVQINQNYLKHRIKNSLDVFLGPLNPTTMASSEKNCEEQNQFLCIKTPKDNSRIPDHLVTTEIFINKATLFNIDPNDPVLEISIVKKTTQSVVTHQLVLLENLQSLGPQNPLASFKTELDLNHFGEFELIVSGIEWVNNQPEYRAVKVEIYRSQDPLIDLMPLEIYPIVQGLKLKAVAAQKKLQANKAGSATASNTYEPIYLAADEVELSYRLKTSYSPGIQVHFLAEHQGIQKFNQYSTVGHQSNIQANCQNQECFYTARVPLADGTNHIKVIAIDAEAKNPKANLGTELVIYNFLKPKINMISPKLNQDKVVSRDSSNLELCLTQVPDANIMLANQNRSGCLVEELNRLNPIFFLNGEKINVGHPSNQGIFTIPLKEKSHFGFNFLELQTSRSVEVIEDLNQSEENKPTPSLPDSFTEKFPTTSPQPSLPLHFASPNIQNAQSTVINDSSTISFLSGEPFYFIKGQELLANHPKDNFYSRGIAFKFSDDFVEGEIKTLLLRFFNNKQGHQNKTLHQILRQACLTSSEDPITSEEALYYYCKTMLLVNPNNFSLGELLLPNFRLGNGEFLFDSVQIKNLQAEAVTKLIASDYYPQNDSKFQNYNYQSYQQACHSSSNNRILCQLGNFLPVNLSGDISIDLDSAIPLKIEAVDSGFLFNLGDPNIYNEDTFEFYNDTNKIFLRAPIAGLLETDASRILGAPFNEQQQDVLTKFDIDAPYSFIDLSLDVLHQGIERGLNLLFDFRDQEMADYFPDIRHPLLHHSFKLKLFGKEQKLNLNLGLTQAKLKVEPHALNIALPIRLTTTLEQFNSLLQNSHIDYFSILNPKHPTDFVDNSMVDFENHSTVLSISEASLNQFLSSLSLETGVLKVGPGYYFKRHRFAEDDFAPFPGSVNQNPKVSHPLAPQVDLDLDGQISDFESTRYAIELQIQTDSKQPPTLNLLSNSELTQWVEREQSTSHPPQTFFSSEHPYLQWGAALEISAYKQELAPNSFRRFCRNQITWSDQNLAKYGVCSSGEIIQHIWDGVEEPPLSRLVTHPLSQIKGGPGFEEKCLAEGGEIRHMPRRDGLTVSHGNIAQLMTPLYRIRLGLQSSAKISQVFSRFPIDPETGQANINSPLANEVRIEFPIFTPFYWQHSIEVLENNTNISDHEIESVFRQILQKRFGERCQAWNEITLPVPSSISLNPTPGSFLEAVQLQSLHLNKDGLLPKILVDEDGSQLNIKLPIGLNE